MKIDEETCFLCDTKSCLSFSVKLVLLKIITLIIFFKQKKLQKNICFSYGKNLENNLRVEVVYFK